MRKSIIKQAKTTKEAIDAALSEINKTIDEVEVEIIEEESKGFLGLIGKSDATVRISYEEDVKETLDDIKIDEIIENEDKNPKEDKTLEKLEIKTTLEKKEKPQKEVKKENKEKEEIAKVEKPTEDIIEVKQQSDIEKFYEAKALLEDILKAMHLEDVSVYGDLEGPIIKLNAKVAEKDTGIAIGRAAQTLEAIEFIIRKAILERNSNLRINIDINNYKKRRDEKIVELARDTAKKVQQSKKSWNLKYMNSYERRLAHEEIAKHKNVTSHSEGQQPKRYVVVSYVEEEEK